MEQTAENKIVSIRLDGENVIPSRFGRDIAALVDAFLCLAGDGTGVGLNDLEKNCVTMRFVMPLDVSPMALVGQTDACACRNKRSLIQTLNRLLGKYQAVMQVRDEFDHVCQTYDGGEKQIPLPEQEKDFSEIMSVYGELTNVGGSEKVNIHLRSRMLGRTICLDVCSREEARKFAARLFTEIGVEAEVKRENGEIIGGKVLRMLPYDPMPWDEWEAKNLPKYSNAFKDVDVEEYIREMRG